MLVVPTSIEIQHTASLPESTFLRALEEGKLVGDRTGKDGKVYFPARRPIPAPASSSTSSSNCPTRAR